MRRQLDCLLVEGRKPAAFGRTAGSRAGIAGTVTTLILFLLHLLLLTGPASAGTETGEFCPTCPDWTDLDGWFEEKAAYEQEIKNEQQNEQQRNEPSRLQNSGENRELKIKAAETGVEPNVSRNSSSALVNSSIISRNIASLDSISPDEVILDISPSGATYIQGAVNIDYESFFTEGGELKPASELAVILGDGGISSNDSLLITGECLPCGGGPSPAFFTYWVMKYLGQEKVRVLEGGIDDWKAAGLNTSNMYATRPKTEYIPLLVPNLLATYEFVAAGGPQIVDARPARDYEIGSIPGAINIPYENVLVNKSIKPAEELEKLFTDLDRNRSVVVYTNIGVEASLVWFALNASGFDARLYSWRDWLENQPEFGYELAEIQARPNPVRSGEATTITASFQGKESETIESQTGENSSSEGEAKLTVKGCATCGFGSPQGFANLDRKDGYVQIGSSGKAAQSSATSSSSSASGLYAPTAEDEDEEGAIKCSAVIDGPDGAEVARTSLLYTSGNRYVGIWNANVAPGIYSVSIVATLSGNAEVFPDVLEVEVTG